MYNTYVNNCARMSVLTKAGEAMSSEKNNDNRIDDSESENDMNIIVLTDEEGNELELEYLDRVTFDGCEYAVMIPCDDDESGDDSDEAADVIILRIDPGSDDTDSYSVVEDDDILAHVFEIFKDRFKDLFDFE